MSKPNETYLRIQRKQKIRLAAEQGKRTFSLSRHDNLSEFQKAVDRVSEDELDEWHRSMAALADDIKNNKPISKEDKRRRLFSEVLGEVRTMGEKANDYKQLEARLQVPVYPVIRAPLNVGSAGIDLVLVAALIRMVEALIRVRRRK